MLLAINRVGKENCRFVFCDTGNEDGMVFCHLDYLQDVLGIKITTLKANFDKQIAARRKFIARDQRNGRRNGRRVRWTNKAKRRALSVLHPTGNPFLDLCLWKGRFPSRRAQFCTQELKTALLIEYQLELIDEGYNVISWQGIRRDESHNRRNAKLYERIDNRLWTFRPIIHWTAQQTIDYCLSMGCSVNDLYSEGFDRVGCMPCINSGKKDIYNVSIRRPDEINRLREWERLVSMASKIGQSSFFPDPDNQAHLEKRGIVAMVEWSKTTHGGKQLDLLIDDEPLQCSSSYGLCE